MKFFLIIVSLSVLCLTSACPDASDLTPFFTYLYGLVTSSDIYDKAFAIPSSSEEAQTTFYTSVRYWSEYFSIPAPPELWAKAFDVAEGNFAGKITPCKIFRAEVVVTEDYLVRKGFLTPDNYIQYADLFFKGLKDAVNLVESINHPLLKLYIRTIGCINFHESLGGISKEDGLAFQEQYVSEFERIRNS